MTNNRLLYQKASKGFAIIQPFVEREVGLETAEEVTQQATAKRVTDKINTSTSETISGTKNITEQSASVTPVDHKADFIAASSSLSTIGTDMPVVPGKDTVLMDTLQSAGKYAGIGAGIGSVFPGAGTAIGAGIGALVGAGLGFFKGKKKKKEADAAYDEALVKREEEEKLYAKAKRTSLRGYGASQTANYMAQAESLYGSTGKVIGIARRGGIVYSPVQVLTYDNKTTIKPVDMPITFNLVRKASKGSEVKLADHVMLCSRVDNSCEITHKSESPFHYPIFRRGGSIVNKLKVNIIPHGVLHGEENNTGLKGDRGMPIVKDGEKVFELERSEWVLNTDTSVDIKAKVYKYLEKPSDKLLMEIGNIIYGEIKYKTYSYDDDYSHLNH